MKLSKISVLFVFLCWLMPVSSFADHDWNDNDLSYDKARRALHYGNVLPLSEVKKHLRYYSDGQIVATEYEYEFERWVYEFKIIDERGRMSMVHIDARDGSVVKVSDD